MRISNSISTFVIVLTHMVEESFTIVGGGEGVNGREKAKVKGEEVRVGGVSAFLEGVPLSSSSSEQQWDHHPP